MLLQNYVFISIFNIDIVQSKTFPALHIAMDGIKLQIDKLAGRGDMFVSKAIDCLKALREGCISNVQVPAVLFLMFSFSLVNHNCFWFNFQFNQYMRDLKDRFVGANNPFWKEVSSLPVAPIGAEEERGGMDRSELDAFFAAAAVASVPSVMEESFDSDDFDDFD
jgi:hypothetical protein